VPVFCRSSSMHVKRCPDEASVSRQIGDDTAGGATAAR
jgi:hypothetical protein